MITKNGRERTNISYPYIFLMAYDGSDNLEYVGMAPTGATAAEAKWKIMRMSYSGSNMQDVLFADGGQFTQIWTNRAALGYA